MGQCSSGESQWYYNQLHGYLQGITRRQYKQPKSIAATTQATLTGLKKYTNYSIDVLASTLKGNGNSSEPIIVITGEDSRF